jgi:hypothetical protein
MKTALLRMNPTVCIYSFKITIFMTFEVLMVVTVKGTIFRDAMPCSLVILHQQTSSRLYYIKSQKIALFSHLYVYSLVYISFILIYFYHLVFKIWEQ